MAKNTLVINCDIGEVRVALIENGILAELHVERKGQRGIVGNIYLGRVSRVLPGMQAAFIDIGEERAAFLHVEDLIRPADFEAYLAGGKRDTEAFVAPSVHPPAEPEFDEPIVVEPDAPVLRETREDDETAKKSTSGDPAMAARRRRRGTWRGEPRAEGPANPNDEETVFHFTEEDAEDFDPTEPIADIATHIAGDEFTSAGAIPAAEITDANEFSYSEDVGADSAADEIPDLAAAEAELDGVSIEEEFGFTVTDESQSGAQPGFRGERHAGNRGPVRGPASREDRRGRFQSQSPRKRGERPERVGERSDRGHHLNDSAPRRGERDKSKEGGLRLGRSTPISEVVKEGQDVIVQVTKDPIGTKGARVSSHISLPGRYVVYLPTVDHVGVSRRIGNDHERRRLREAIDAMKPPQGGLIVRTVAEGLTKKQLKADVGYLVRLWGEILRKKEEALKANPKAAPMPLSQELDVILRTARDMFTDDVEKIVIDDKEQYQRLLRFIEMFMPDRASAIEYYPGDEPIFDAYGLEDEIARALSRKVPLSSGGYLIIDEAEALTAIDVNSGRYVGKGNRDPEDTIVQTNLEAVKEIAYQLRFRNIGGLIVLDLIDMDRPNSREKVYRALEQELLADKAKTSINRISDLGLVEMTRKRTRESLGRSLHEPCFYCDGTGHLSSRASIAFEILRQIRRERQTLAGYKVVVNAHPTVVDLLQTFERESLKEAERRYQRQIMLVPRKDYHLEQFDLSGS